MTTYMDFYQTIGSYFSDRWDKQIILELNGEKYTLELVRVKGSGPVKIEPKLVKLENQNENKY